MLVCLAVSCFIFQGSTSASVMQSTSASQVTSSSSAKELVTKDIVLYDGSVDSLALINTTKFDVALTVKGFSTTVRNIDFTLGEKHYTKATPTNGKSTSSRYIKIEIPESFEKTTLKVVATTDTTNLVNIGFSISAEFNDEDTLILQTPTSNSVLAVGTVEDISSGTYYVTFDGNARIAEISLSCTGEEDNVLGTAVTSNSTITKIKIMFGAFSVLTLILVLILCINSCVNKKTYKNKK